jgi:CubicO group peptidase (beta-lactamase class C family)
MNKIAFLFLFSSLFSAAFGQADIRQLKPLSLFQPLIDQGEISGVVTLVATKDKIISLETAGSSNLEKRNPMKRDGLFWVASQTKPITAVAFMMLLEEKKLSLDDTLYKYIPAFRKQRVEIEIDQNCAVLRKPKRPITFRDLLNHTSGLPSEPPVQKGPYDRVLLEDIMPGYAYTHLVQDPGEKQIYSSMGINTIGRLIEILSGMKYDEFLRTRIFDPLGMKSTTFVPTEEQLKRMVTAYQKTNGTLQPAKLGFTHPLSDPNRVAQPFGGLFSTAEDLLQFCRMCLNGGELDGRRYLQKNSLDSMIVRRSVSPFGAGWMVYKDGSYGHSGAFNTDMTIFPVQGLIAITMVQAPSWYGCRSLLPDAIRELEKKE